MFEYQYVIIAYLNDLKGLQEQYDVFMANSYEEIKVIQSNIFKNRDRYNRHVLYKRYL